MTNEHWRTFWAMRGFFGPAYPVAVVFTVIGLILTFTVSGDWLNMVLGSVAASVLWTLAWILLWFVGERP